MRRTTTARGRRGHGLRALGALAVSIAAITILFLLGRPLSPPLVAGDPPIECPVDYVLGEHCPDGGSPGSPEPPGDISLDGYGGIMFGGPAFAGGSSEGPPDPLTFQDDGSVVFTSRVDPSQEATRDRVLVDPASGALTFRIPLPHQIRGRNHDLGLELIYRSNYQSPRGKLGTAGFMLNLQKLLVIEGALPREKCIEDPVRTDLKGFLNSVAQIT